MLDLRKDKGGIIAIMDALMFLFILSIVSLGLFSYIETADVDQPLAKTVCDDFFSIELRACDIYPTDDTQTFPIADLIAADLNTDSKGHARTYVRSSIEDVIPPMYGYQLKLSYNGKSMEISRDMYEMTSEYEKEIEVNGGGRLHVDLRIS